MAHTKGLSTSTASKVLSHVHLPASIVGLVLGGTSGALAVVTTTSLSVGGPALGTVVVAAARTTRGRSEGQ